MTDALREPDVVEEELVAEDDAIIGKALRWSLAGLAVLAAAAAAVVWFARPEAVRIEVKEALRIGARATQVDALPPAVRFTDVAANAGIDYVHENGARGEKLLPETMGAGVAVFDRDSDGDQDLLFANGSPWPHDLADGGAVATMALFDNDGSGRFANATESAGLDLSFYGMGVAVGDVEGDGDPDVFASAVGPNHLFENDGLRFVDATDAAGLAGAPGEWSTSAAFVDLENDGDLDLFVCNYVRWTRDIDKEVDYRLTGVGRAYGPPTNFEGAHCYLYSNDGAGRFTDVSDVGGVRVSNSATGVPVAKALGVAPCDIDDDGFVDLVVANDTVPKFLFHNRGDGTFVESGVPFGVGFDRAGNSTGAMGIDGGYFRNDESIGFAIGNFANEMSSLYVTQNKRTRFADEAITEGIGAATRAFLSFGLFFFDYDLDGRLDLLQANGHLEEEINKTQPSQHYEQPAQLFWNAGLANRTTFVEVDRSTVGDLSRPIVGRGSAFGDLDGDGDLDVVITQTGGPALVLRNEQAMGHHWLRVVLEGVRSNREGIGAWIELSAGGVVQRRQVMPAKSYLSSSERVVTFGLGGATKVDSLTVIWPGRLQQDVPVPGVDRTLFVREE